MTSAFGLGRPPLSAPADNQPVDNSTPWIAASDGNLNLLQHALTTLNLTPSCQDENGYTLLQAAASYSRAAVMQWLIQAPQAVNVNAVDTEGDSALHYADKVEAATYLVQSGIDTALLNVAGKTALQSKQEDMDEMMADEDTEDDDVDLLNLRALIEYLTSLNGMTMAQ
jgi:ankyrin repeat protein